jgi:hypothetical protein
MAEAHPGYSLKVADTPERRGFHTCHYLKELSRRIMDDKHLKALMSPQPAFVSVCEKCYPQYREHENKTGGIIPCSYCGNHDSKSIYANPEAVKLAVESRKPKD